MPTNRSRLPDRLASVLDRWRLGLDRSVACARGLATVLARNPDAIGQGNALDQAEECLRRALAAASPGAGAELAANWNSLGRILELKDQTPPAVTCYRQAFNLLDSNELDAAVLGTSTPNKTFYEPFQLG